jgi:thiamine pyrophosphate-dependent acetolactate synthase large subunit-like protein
MFRMNIGQTVDRNTTKCNAAPQKVTDADRSEIFLIVRMHSNDTMKYAEAMGAVGPMIRTPDEIAPATKSASVVKKPHIAHTILKYW